VFDVFQSLGQYISDHFVGRAILNLDRAVCDLVLDPMILDVDMFGARIVD
jgi:hypothetical protein